MKFEFVAKHRGIWPVAMLSFSGDVQLRSMPKEREPFPWPSEWLTRFREVFDRAPLQVSGEPIAWSRPPASVHFEMFGLVCLDLEEAREVAQHIERCSGIMFDEYAQG